jgi:hypothetical protein
VQVAEERSRKSPQVLRRFHQPVQDRIGVDLEDPSGGANAQAFGQARQDAHDQLDSRLLAMEERAIRL